MAVGSTKVVQVTNIAPQATKDQMQALFGYLGKIEDIRLYPTVRDVSCPVQSRICYIKFIDSATVGIAQHMTNTVFIDRALIVIPVQNGDIPDEYYALEMTKNGTVVPGLCPTEPKLPANVVNSIKGSGSDQVIITSDPRLLENGLPPYPPLPVNYDSCKIEEIRRTVLVVNPDPSITTEDLITFFNPAGEIKYLMHCTRTSDNTNHILVEFSEQPSVIEALKLNNTKYKDFDMEIQHSTQAIVKPQAKSNEAAQKEIEEAMSRVKEAQNLISAAIDPVIGMLSKDKRGSRRSRSRSRRRRSRSRSRSRQRSRRSGSRSRRSRSRDRTRRRRSGSRRRSRSRSRHGRRSKSKQERRRSRERSRGKSKEKVKRRSREKSVELEVEKKRSRSPGRYSRNRSRSRDRKTREKEKRRSRSRGSRRKSPSPTRSRKRSRSRSKRSRSRSKRSRSRSKRSRSKSRDRKREKKEKKDRKERSRSRSKVRRNYDEEEKGFDHGKKESGEGEKESPEKSDSMDISNSP